MKLIFERHVEGRRGFQPPKGSFAPQAALPEDLTRKTPLRLPQLAEADVVRHYTRLSRLNFSVDTNFYPLGSCTMKYNPRICEKAAAMPEFAGFHPWWPQLPGGGRVSQGILRILYETARMLADITGMAEFTLQPLAGAHGELTGSFIIAAYHRRRGNRKTHVIVPDSAHGTNPASARMAGFDVVTIPSDASGVMDFARFREAVNDETAAVMLTSPNTLGLFNPRLREIAEIIHGVDGLFYYDGANMNALLGRCRPGKLGFDLCHLNLHKTFAAPHGGGGPGSGPVGVSEKLRRFLPVPRIVRDDGGRYGLVDDAPESIGRVAPFYGNFGVILKAYVYLLLLGREGLRQVSDAAVLNANYVQEKLRPYLDAVTSGRCMHECVFSGRRLLEYGVGTLDLAKGLIEKGFHPPTVYFPLIVPEALMIEPTESENRETLDAFIAAVKDLVELAAEDPERLHRAPQNTPVGRLDEVAAARRMQLVYSE